ncbi:MAG: MFS transporter, partial [Pseudomonadota bacterium]
TPPEVGNWLGVILLIVSTSGVFASGWLTDRFSNAGHKDGSLRAMVFGSVAVAIPVLLFPQVDSFGVSIALAAVAFFFGPFPMVTSAASLQILSPNQMRAQISALFLLVTNLLGMGVGTTVVALVTDYGFGSDEAVGRSLGIVCFISALAAAALLQACRRPYLESLRKVAAREPGKDL